MQNLFEVAEKVGECEWQCAVRENEREIKSKSLKNKKKTGEERN